MQCPGDLHTLTGHCVCSMLMTTAMPFIVLKYPVSNAWCTAGMVGLQISVSFEMLQLSSYTVCCCWPMLQQGGLARSTDIA